MDGLEGVEGHLVDVGVEYLSSLYPFGLEYIVYFVGVVIYVFIIVYILVNEVIYSQLWSILSSTFNWLPYLFRNVILPSFSLIYISGSSSEFSCFHFYTSWFELVLTIFCLFLSSESKIRWNGNSESWM